MCRNITTLRGLEPPATAAEIRAAAEQYVRKVGGVPRPTGVTAAAYSDAVERVAAATTQLLADLPPRRVPPSSDPPLRRLTAPGMAGQPAPNTSATSDNP